MKVKNYVAKAQKGDRRMARLIPAVLFFVLGAPIFAGGSKLAKILPA